MPLWWSAILSLGWSAVLALRRWGAILAWRRSAILTRRLLLILARRGSAVSLVLGRSTVLAWRGCAILSSRWRWLSIALLRGIATLLRGVLLILHWRILGLLILLRLRLSVRLGWGFWRILVGRAA